MLELFGWPLNGVAAMHRGTYGGTRSRSSRRTRIGCLVTVTGLIISVSGLPGTARAQDPQCRGGDTVSGEAMIGSASRSQAWTGPRWSTDAVDHVWCNWDHFYLRVTETGSFRVAISWEKATDDFDLMVCEGRIGVTEFAPGGDACKRTSATSGADTSETLELLAMDPGDYTIRVVYARVIDAVYSGVASFLDDGQDDTPAERRQYPLIPNDPLFDPQWGITQIEAPQAWQERNATGHGITIAIVDSGVDLTHPDLNCPGKLLVLPGSKIDAEGRPQDEDGHGTHVAGIAAGCTHNGTGVAGVAPDATIMPVNVFDADQSVLPGGLDHMLAAGIRFACGPPAAPGDPCGTAGQGAHVINLSIGPPPGESFFPRIHPETEAALKEAYEAGVVIVAAAGNFGLPVCEYPSLSRFVVCVGATDSNDQKTGYSDSPNNMDEEGEIHAGVLAPGGDLVPSGPDPCAGRILSTYLAGESACSSEPGYAALAGTSMASPHVAGVAALVYDRLGGKRTQANVDSVVQAIISTAKDLYAPGYDPFSGFGRVDALMAVQSVRPAEEEGGQLEPSPTPGQSTQPSPEPSPSSSDPAFPTPHQVTVSPRDVKGRVGTESTLTVTVVDADGEALSGIPVEWATVGVGELVGMEESTDAAGRAVATVVADEPGDQGIMVWADSCDGEGRCWDTATRHHGPELCDVFGTRGDDVLGGTAAAEVICGFGGADSIFARSGRDTLIAGSGHDDLRGGAGNDRLRGGRGGDLLIGGKGRDVLLGGAGTDTCRTAARDRSHSCR